MNLKAKSKDMRKIITKIFPFTLAVACLPQIVLAADKADKTQTFNAMLVGLVTLCLVLLAAIGILGNVLRQLAFVYRDKIRNERTNTTITKVVLLLLALSIPTVQCIAQEATDVMAETSAAAPAYISGIAASDFYFLIGIIVLELLVIVSMLLTMGVLVRLLSRKPETAKAVKGIMRKPFWDRFHNAVAIEDEKDITIDHDYDGIRELDNNLPSWWKYGFYVTIVVAVVYMYYYHMGGEGPSSYDEYVAEVEQGEKEKAEYLAKSANNVDENTVTMLDATAIVSGQNIFQSSCAACHSRDGGGGVGPNLTDDYWLHGGSIQEVFKSIKYGWPDKGMKSWKDDFSPKQLAELASYVKSLKGSAPAAPKEKQGELYIEGNAPAQDSTKALAVK